MADEVIIEEYATFGSLLPIATVPITTQVLDIATASAAFTSNTKYIRIRSKGTGFWYKIGATAALAAATADTDGNTWLPADQSVPHRVSGGMFIDTAADA